MEKMTVERSGRKSEQPQRTGTPGEPTDSKKGSDFIVQGNILAVAGITVRLISMLYRIPLTNKIGDDGNGYYNAAYSIYSILLVVSPYSLPVAVSKMVPARLVRSQFHNSVRILYMALFYATMTGTLGFTALWSEANYFVTVVIRILFSAHALRALASIVWIVAYLGVLGGYFQRHSIMIPTVVSQIFEQIVNAIISIVAAVALFDIGVKFSLVYGSDQYAYALDAAGDAISTGAGAVAALLFFLLLAMGYRSTMKSRAKRNQSGYVENYETVSRAPSLTIAPITLSSVIYNIGTMMDNNIFGDVITDLKQGERIASDRGVWGKYHLLFSVPVAIASSLSPSLIPSLSRTVAKRNRKQVLSRVANAIRFVTIISIPSVVGLTVLAYPTSNLLFPSVNSAMLTKMTTVGSMAVVFFSLSTVTNVVLQGINRMRVPIMSSAIVLVTHVGILYEFLYGMKSGVYDVVHADILFALVAYILSGLSIGRALRYRQGVPKTFLISTVASGIMGATAYGMYQLIFRVTGTTLRGRLGITVYLMPAILVTVLVYFVLLVKLRGVGEDEMRGMLEGTKLIRAARRLHPM